MFSLVYSEQALKQLGKLEKSIRERILKALERIRIRPTTYVKKLVASPYFRLRVGEYRVIVDIKSEEMVIMVIEIGYRRNIYK